MHNLKEEGHGAGGEYKQWSVITLCSCSWNLEQPKWQYGILPGNNPLFRIELTFSPFLIELNVFVLAVYNYNLFLLSQKMHSFAEVVNRLFVSLGKKKSILKKSH